MKGIQHGRRVDGLVLLYSRIDDELIDFLKENQFPFSMVGKPYRNLEEITHVDNDNFKAAKEAADFLIELGHERIGFVGGGLDLVVTMDRLLGYEKAIRKAGLPYRNDYIVHQDFLQEGGRQAIIKLMSVDKPPTGFIVADDMMALGIVNALNEMNLSVPEDISIISFNNVLLARYSTPALTSVDINIFQLGYTAADCLFQIIDEDSLEPMRISIPYTIVKRQSCEKV
ncbi:substrate-binding family protein [Scopulibacillus darangshiensis]|uniref:Substrate-binding family protein n=1 Tax=Scopulibacillus darangshiensis TaxID=442528 RepID=A0A4R2NV84_9BACL|nr:substrate-binding domain-containing protein [Scopulibacillus darangshiensis]TCP25999.1 substrate-binding family protein [Scopulibacillus darangshiensis]